jgi:hypothetical protein
VKFEELAAHVRGMDDVAQSKGSYCPHSRARTCTRCMA